MLKILSGVAASPWLWCAVVSAAVSLWMWGAAGHQQAAVLDAQFSKYRENAEHNARMAEQAEREIEQQRHRAQKEVEHAQALSRAREAAAARADAIAAGAAAARVRGTAAAAVAAGRAACADPAAAGRCEAVAGALADAFGACVEGHRQLGAEASEQLAEARARGSKCAGLYDALTGSEQP